MRYIDTGSRDPAHALGTWLRATLLEASTVATVRVQTGFFNSEVLGFFGPTFLRLGKQGGVTRLLIGSNDGGTSRGSLEDLLALVGPPRHDLAVAVVSYANAYFHPKVLHFERADGSATAYIGSANLTHQGVSKHVESGILLDTLDGDPAGVLREIAVAVDSWFGVVRAGFFPVASADDLAALADAQLIDVVRPTRPRRVLSVTLGDSDSPVVATLSPMLRLPKTTIVPDSQEPQTGSSPVVTHWWSKTLSASDAQRKRRGNQRGSITLVQADRRGEIEHDTYFRYDFYESASWAPGWSSTGKLLDRAFIPMTVAIDGKPKGVLDIEITYEPNRDAKQANYTSLLHLGPLTAEFRERDLTGSKLRIEALSDGTFTLSIES